MNERAPYTGASSRGCTETADLVVEPKLDVRKECQGRPAPFTGRDFGTQISLAPGGIAGAIARSTAATVSAHFVLTAPTTAVFVTQFAR